jgi:hypothetical protein
VPGFADAGAIMCFICGASLKMKTLLKMMSELHRPLFLTGQMLPVILSSNYHSAAGISLVKAFWLWCDLLPSFHGMIERLSVCSTVSFTLEDVLSLLCLLWA